MVKVRKNISPLVKLSVAYFSRIKLHWIQLNKYGGDMTEKWKFSHNKAAEAIWTEGLREIFEYRDLGIKDATKGDYVAHIVKANGKEMSDEVQHWHMHDCEFQFVMVLNGWAEFEYEGEGVRRIQKGDCLNQRPGIAHREIACSKDFEVLEIVSPANFETRMVDAPAGVEAAE